MFEACVGDIFAHDERKAFIAKIICLEKDCYVLECIKNDDSLTIWNLLNDPNHLERLNSLAPNTLDRNKTIPLNFKFRIIRGHFYPDRTTFNLRRAKGFCMFLLHEQYSQLDIYEELSKLLCSHQY